MTISVGEAREKLSRVGMDLLGATNPRRSGDKAFIVTTPVGTQVAMQSHELINLVRDLRKLSPK